jgi:hypothetical protein
MDKVPAGIIAKNNNALVFRYGVATGRCYRDLTTDTALDSYDGEPSTKIALSSLGVKASKPSARNRWPARTPFRGKAFPITTPPTICFAPSPGPSHLRRKI